MELRVVHAQTSKGLLQSYRMVLGGGLSAGDILTDREAQSIFVGGSFEKLMLGVPNGTDV